MKPKICVGLAAAACLVIGLGIAAVAMLKDFEPPVRIAERKPAAVVLKDMRVGSREITGYALNASGRKIGSGRIEFALYDGDAKVGDTRARIWEWEPGQQWKFDARIFHDANRVSIQRVVCDGEEVEFEGDFTR